MRPAGELPEYIAEVFIRGQAVLYDHESAVELMARAFDDATIDCNNVSKPSQGIQESEGELWRSVFAFYLCGVLAMHQYLYQNSTTTEVMDNFRLQLI